MSAALIVRRRLAGQCLSLPGPATPADVVRMQGAVQSQDYPGAKWALALRTRTPVTDAQVEAAYDAGAILRTHVLRPTWHFVAPEDIRWMLTLTGPRVQQFMASYNRKFGLTPMVFRRSGRIISQALAGHRHLTRGELRAELISGGLKIPSAQWLAHLVMDAELEGLICSGPMRGKQFTYALLDERVPARGPVYTRDEALGELARRYFRTRSPATVHDFAWWSGLTIRDATRAITIAGQLREWRWNDRAFWIDESVAVPARSKATAHLLPNYDEYFIGYRDRSAIGGRIASISAVTGGSTLIAHVAFIDGLLVGGWRRTLHAGEIVVDIAPVTRLSTVERRRLEREAARLSAFLERPVALRWKNS